MSARERASDAREAFNAAVYRDQLGEIERDRARGLIGEARPRPRGVEIARRLLPADSKARAAESRASPWAARERR